MKNNATQPDLDEALWDSAASTTSSIEFSSMSDALFHELALNHRLPLRRSLGWATDAKEIEIEGATELVRTHVGPQRTAVLDVEGVLVHARVMRGNASVALAYEDEARADRVLERLRAALPEPKPPSGPPRAPIGFSWMTKNGISRISRMLEVQAWGEIAGNYSKATRASLDHLMHDFRPGNSGQTIVWHGEPGTGKTNALRALAYEWREWCDVHVVTDPDRLFGSEADYLMELIASDDRPASDRYRLIVLEDSGELLSGDARRLVGHGLSRFLNVCDGMLGQTERVLLLVTTNEPLRRLHPAVRRPGRCAAEVEFTKLSVAEVARWLDGRVAVTVEKPIAIADLYALRRGSRLADRNGHGSATIGFGAALIREAHETA